MRNKSGDLFCLLHGQAASPAQFDFQTAQPPDERQRLPRLLAPRFEAGSAWAPLRDWQFRGLWLANIVSNIGTTMNDTAAIWTMTSISASPLLVALMQTMTGLPLFLLALPAGALADLVDRRKLILLAQAGALLTAAGMTYLAFAGKLSAPLLLLATFQLGVASAFTMPAWQALIPDLVGRSQLSAALALGSVASTPPVPWAPWQAACWWPQPDRAPSSPSILSHSAP